jgi:mono/diheme cytochrome c family protein
MPARMHRRVLIAISTLAVTATAAGCGTEKNDDKQPGKLPTAGIAPEYRTGAKLFVERCSGCHNLDLVGAEGGAQKVKDRERVDGPNFNVRKEDADSVLYALRNGGFSGAIMPQDIVVGKEAQDVAAFLAEYAGGGPQDSASQTNGGS